MSDRKATGADLEERRRKADELKKSARFRFADLLKFSAPETPVQRTKRQLNTARSIAGENASAETVASIAQTLAINEQTAIAQAQKR